MIDTGTTTRFNMAIPDKISKYISSVTNEDNHIGGYCLFLILIVFAAIDVGVF
jgi:hypothetical protein